MESKMNLAVALLLLVMVYETTASVTISIHIHIGRRKRDVASLEKYNLPNLPCDFDVFDTNSDGKIDPIEFIDTEKKYGFNDNFTLFRFLDKNADRNIVREEFKEKTPLIARPMIFQECMPKQ